MLLRLKHSGKVTELLASKEQNIIKERAKFLVEVSDKRKEIVKEYKANVKASKQAKSVGDQI